MSWDIFVQDFPAEAQTVADIPDDCAPSGLGNRAVIIAKISQVIPEVDFSDPTWGVIDGADWSIEVNLGEAEYCRSLALHIRGGEEAVAVVDAVLEALGCRAIDSQTGEFFVAGPAAKASFKQWRAYRDSVAG